MPSNLDSFLEEVRLYFTASELVEFLNIDIDDIIEAFEDTVYKHKKELIAEIR